MKGRRTEHQVKQGGIVRLYDKEEDLLCWDFEQSGSKNGVRGICPDFVVYQVRVPWRCGDDGNLDMVSALPF